jgi:hypothetical protein
MTEKKQKNGDGEVKKKRPLQTFSKTFACGLCRQELSCLKDQTQHEKKGFAAAFL